MVQLRTSNPTFATGSVKLVNENGVLLLGRYNPFILGTYL